MKHSLAQTTLLTALLMALAACGSGNNSNATTTTGVDTPGVDTPCTGQVPPDTLSLDISNSTGAKSPLAECSRS